MDIQHFSLYNNALNDNFIACFLSVLSYILAKDPISWRFDKKNLPQNFWSMISMQCISSSDKLSYSGHGTQKRQQAAKAGGGYALTTRWFEWFLTHKTEKPNLTEQKPQEKKSSKASEIDDIFASKSKKSDKSHSEAPIEDNVEDAASDGSEEDEEEELEEGSAVEEVVFAEIAAVKQLKRARPPPPPADDDDRFADSRGKKASKLRNIQRRTDWIEYFFIERTTEEGYPLYDVKDLHIGEGQGKREMCLCAGHTTYHYHRHTRVSFWLQMLLLDMSCFIVFN